MLRASSCTYTLLTINSTLNHAIISVEKGEIFLTFICFSEDGDNFLSALLTAGCTRKLSDGLVHVVSLVSEEKDKLNIFQTLQVMKKILKT